MFSHVKQRHSHTDARSHMLDEGLALTEAGQVLTEGRASQNARSHRKQGLTEGPTL